MIVGRDFVFVLAPKSASSSITQALLWHGVHTLHRHEPLTRQPPQPIVAAVVRPFDDIVRSAERYGPDWIAYGNKQLRDCPRDLWLRFVNCPLRFERLREDWIKFCEAAGLGNIDLQHFNQRIMEQV